MAKRLLAVLVAAGLVVGAIAVRALVIDGDDDGATDPTPSGPARPVVVWCLEDLAEVCRAALGDQSVELVVEPMAASLARLASAEVDDDLPDAWVTFAPLPEMAADALRRAGGPADSVATSTDTVATTGLVVATRPDRAALLAEACPAPAPWRCLGERAGTAWTTVGGPASFQVMKPAFGDPTTSATALTTWVSAVGHYLGRDTYSINDVLADDGFTTWGRRLRAADPLGGAGDPLEELELSRVQRDIAGGLEAVAGGLDGVSVVSSPYGRVDLVVAGFAGSQLSEARLARLRESAGAAGWIPADPAAPPAPAARPAATTYIALQQTWEDLG